MILDELQASRQWLLNELWALTPEYDPSIVDVDPTSLQRVLIRRVPEVCALMSQTLLRVSPGDAELLIEEFFDHPWFRIAALSGVASAMEVHWIRYLSYLRDWHGWEPVVMDDVLELDLEIQCFRNPADGRLVADFVGLVEWPVSHRAVWDPLQAAYRRDAEEVYEALEAEWGWEFLGLRCITPATNEVAVHWLQPATPLDEEVAAIDDLNPESGA